MTVTFRPNLNPWLANASLRTDSKLRLFCFPYSGAGASIFRPWVGNLPAEIEVCPLRLPGREDRLGEAPFTSILPLARTLANALLPDLDRPFAFFGHSLGALVAFEVARYLKACMSVQPAHLVVSAHAAPHLPHSTPPIHALPEDQFLEKIRELNGTSEAVLACAELRQIILPILRADFTACETYTFVPGEALDCPISAFGGLQDACLTRAGLEAWRIHTRGTFKLRMFPGDHFFINKDPLMVTEVLSRELYHLTNRNERTAAWNL